MSRPATTDREGMQRIREALARVEQQLAYISRERAPGLTTQVPGLDVAIVKADEDIAGIEEPEGESDNEFKVSTGECTVLRLLADTDKVLRKKSWKLEGRAALHNVGRAQITEGDVLIALGDADTGWWIAAQTASIRDGVIDESAGINAEGSGTVKIVVDGVETGESVQAHYAHVTVVANLPDQTKVRITSIGGKHTIIDHECPPEENGE